MPTLDAPTKFITNVGAHRWKTTPPDTTKEPDRFAPFPGHNNWRGGAIYSYDQLKQLRDKYGIKTIVNLSYGSMKHQKGSGKFSSCGYVISKSKYMQNCEPQWAQALGMSYVFVPMTGEWRMTTAKWDLIKAALAEGNAYVHCTHGVDRTGGVVARWRVEIDPTLTPSQALAYTRIFGGHWREDRDYRKTANVKVGDWVMKGKYDAALAKKALRPRKAEGKMGTFVVGSVVVVAGVWMLNNKLRSPA